MMKRSRLILILLVLALLAGTVSAAGSTQSPYAIKVNRVHNTVTIYGLDAQGQYTVPVKAMICSTAREGYLTPLGSYRLADYRSEWRLMVDGTYGQYATSFNGAYLFHSICYSDDAHDAMVRESYNKLGSAASMGCVRLETIDAKWIFDNCPAGTPVTVYDDPSSPGPLGKPEPTVDEISASAYNGWDPTDPAEGNPWQQNVTALTLDTTALALDAGETFQLGISTEPIPAVVYCASTDESIATVDSQGKITALSNGSVTIAVRSYNGLSAACSLQVSGELLPFDDLIPGSWYYAEVRQALERGQFSGMGDRLFCPNEAVTRGMLVQILYNMKGRPEAPAVLAYTDVAEDAWYRDAVAWAAAEGIVNGVSETEFMPERPVTRQELATVLWRHAGSPEADATTDVYTDAEQISDYARPALAWMTSIGAMQGSGTLLLPLNTASRIEAAAILQRSGIE